MAMPTLKLIVTKALKKLIQKEMYENEHLGVRKCLEISPALKGVYIRSIFYLLMKSGITCREQILPLRGVRGSFHSGLTLFTGLAIAAFTAGKLIVINAMSTDTTPAVSNTHQ